MYRARLLKQYIYPASSIGLPEWPSGTLRLEGIEVTEDPTQADVFTVPGALTQLFPNTDSLYRLPYLRGNEARHVFFDCSDNEPLYGLPCMFIRCNTRPWYFEKDPNTISWPWPVESYDECFDVPEGGFKYDLSFQAWLSSDCRKIAAKSCKETPGLNLDFSLYDNFTGYIWESSEGLRRRKEFRRSMKESRVMLCPESIPGVFPYRFFEAMSAARVPLLIGTGFVFPWKDEIPYAQFSLQINSANRAGEAALDLVRKHSDSDLIDMGRMARKYWERWLDSRKWPALHAEAVLKKMGVAA